MIQKLVIPLIFAAAIAGFPTRVTAQIPGLTEEVSTPPPSPPAESEAETRARLEEWLKESRAALARDEEPSAETRLPQGIDTAALGDRRRDLDQTVRTLNRILSIFAELPKAEEAVAAAQTANREWSNFSEKPPYSVLKLDDLVNQRESTHEKDAAIRSSIALFTKSFDGIEQETKHNEDRIREGLEAIERSENKEAPKWHLGVARARARLLTVRTLYVRANIDLLELQSSATDARLALLDRQIGVVRQNVSFTDKDLAIIRKASDERRVGLRDEMTKIRQRLKDASTSRTAAKASFDELAAAPESPALALASAKLSAAEARVEALQFISDNLGELENLESSIPEAYESRKILTETKDPARRKVALENLHSLINRLHAWEIVSANELTAANADLAKHDSNLSLIQAGDPRLAELSEQRKAMWEKQNFLQRVAQSVIGYRKNVARWLGEFEGPDDGKTWRSKLSKSGKAAWTWVERVWSFEVLRSQNVRDVAGVPITDTHVVKLGVVVTAVVFFIILYLIASRLSRHVQGLIVRRGHIAEAQANTLRTWMMIVVGVILALSTLHYLEIPLTVFAFFGGALAIGLGFGTQTLIKNFISGIIVLFERKIRVGDIVEVEGSSGKIVEINTRSSVLRSVDGKETLIPNALFLESRVTNLTLSNRRVRRQLRVGVAYGSSPPQVAEILKDCVDRHGLILKEPAPVVTFEDFGDNALIFVIYFWTMLDEKTDPSVVASDIRMMIDKTFGEAGVGFPSPRTELHLDSDKPIRIEQAPSK